MKDKDYKEIQVGLNSYFWKHGNNFTNILNDEGDFIFNLPRILKKSEIEAAIFAYEWGFINGRKIGNKDKQIEIKRILGL